MSKSKSKLFALLVLLILPPLATFSLDLPHAGVLAIFITAIGLWLTEAVPLPVTGLLVPILCSIYGALPASSAFNQFGSDILFLFLGCFFMGRSMEKYGFDKRLAYFLLSRCTIGTSFFGINLIIALTSFFLSMWISNTSATAILSAVTLGIINSLEKQIPDEKIQKMISIRLLLTCAFAASIGGLATPVGSPPNLIALKILSQNGININFLEWMLVALPISICMLIAMLLIFKFVFPVKDLSFPGIKQQFSKALKDLGPMKTGEIEIASIFLLTIFLWIAPGILHSIFPDNDFFKILDQRLSMSVVGLGAGLLAFFLPIWEKGEIFSNLEWKETDKVEWGTLMLFGGGLTLGMLLEESGAAREIGQFLFMGNTANPYILGIAVVFVSIIMSEFASNTAAASILIPLIIGSTLGTGLSSEIAKTIVLAATFGASFGFMLPVSTPPNAIVYGTGKVPASSMRQAGIFFDIIGALLIIGYLFLMT